MGCIPDNMLLEVYSSSNLLVLLSRLEGFGLVVAEAQSSGLPVVVSDITGPNEIVVNGVSGLIVGTENAIAVANAIQHHYRMWENEPSKYRKACELSRENAVKRFNLTNVAQRISQMFIEVKANYKRAGALYKVEPY